MPGPLVQRNRQRSIRVLLTAIFIVPLASLIGLWAFAASATVTSAVREHNFKTENTLYGGSAQGLGTQLSQERLIAYEYLSSGRRLPEQQLLVQFTRTSDAVSAFFTGVKAGPGMFQPSSWPALTAWENQLRGPLTDLRTKIEGGQISPLGAFGAYNRIINGQFAVYSTLISIDNSTLYREAAASIEAGKALEMAQRETTLLSGALAAGGQMPREAKLAFTAAASNKRLLMSDALSQLPPALGSGYRAILTSQPYQSFAAIENAVIGSIGSRGPIPVTPAQFGAAATPLFARYLQAETQDRNALTAEGTRVGDRLLLEVGLAGGAGLVAVIVSIFLMVRFGRRISRELRGLQRAALDLAENRLPNVVQRLSSGEDVDVAAEAAPIAAGRILETARVAQAFASVQRTAVEAAVGQARLRRGVSQVFRNLAWRSQSLLHRQLALLDTMERRQTEPETLDELFQLDHLTTRMRRHAEGLIILSGAAPGRGWRDPVPVMDVLRAAIAEVEDYKRVTVVCDSQDAVVGTAVADVIHLMAELIENATTYSPASTEVMVRAERVANGFVAEVEDRGIGISAEDVATYNEQLASPREFDLADSNQLGLFVVARLAAKHDVTVTLRRSPYGGTSAIVLLPNSIVANAERSDAGPFEVFRGELRPGEAAALPGPFPSLSLVGSEPASIAPAPGPDRSGARLEVTSPVAYNGGAAPAERVGEVIQAEVASSQILRPDMPAGPSVTGSPPWPPAEPVPGDASLGHRSASPWFQSRPPGSADAQPVARPPVAQPPVGPPSPAPALPQRRATQYVHHEPASPEAPQQHAQYGQPSHQQPQTGARHSVWDTGKMTPAPVREAPPAELPRQAPSPREALPPREALAPNQPLPRRQRQASLVPQLRDSGPAPIEELQDGSDGPSPDGSRALVQSLQYGLDLARATPDPEQEWPDTEQSWPTDPWQPTQSWPSGDWPHQSRPDSAASAEDSEGQ